MMEEVGQARPGNVVTSPQKLRRRMKENRMTPEYLKEHCRRNDLYMTPKFNTVLYLHHKVGISSLIQILTIYCRGSEKLKT